MVHIIFCWFISESKLMGMGMSLLDWESEGGEANPPKNLKRFSCLIKAETFFGTVTLPLNYICCRAGRNKIFFL